MTYFGQIMNSGMSGSNMMPDIALTLALAFLLGQLVAWAYMCTHTGISYSRGFVQSIVLLTIVVALAMMVIGSNVAVAFGLLGALSMIRFRNVLKDTRDTAFVFFAVVIGIACGTYNYTLAVTGAVIFCLLSLYQYAGSFGSRRGGDGFLRFQCSAETWNTGAVQSILQRYCQSTWLVTQCIPDGGPMEIAYLLAMRDLDSSGSLVAELRSQEGVSAVSYALHQEDET